VRGRGAQGRRHRRLGCGHERTRAAADPGEATHADGQHNQSRYGGEQRGGVGGGITRQQPDDHRYRHEHRGTGRHRHGQRARPPAQLTSRARTGQCVGDQAGREPGDGECAGEDEVRCDVHIDSLHPYAVNRNRVITGPDP
jgi:hypothetical protein